MKDLSKLEVQNPASLPSNPKQRVIACWEPTVIATIITPSMLALLLPVSLNVGVSSWSTHSLTATGIATWLVDKSGRRLLLILGEKEDGEEVTQAEMLIYTRESHKGKTVDDQTQNAIATTLKHPSGCAMTVNVHGSGLGVVWHLIYYCFVPFCCVSTGWYGLLIFLPWDLRYRNHPHGCLDFWMSLPRRIQSMLTSLVRKFKGPSEGHQSSYSPVNF